MTINLTFKTQIYPTKNQKAIFERAFGVRRWTWNWGLETYLKSLNEVDESSDKKYGKSNYDLQKELNGLIKDNNELSWHKETCSMVRQEVLKDLFKSINEYHKKQKKARRTTEELDIEKFKPKFKSKRKDTQPSFRIHNKGSNPFKVINKYHFKFTWAKLNGKFNPITVKTAESTLFLKSDDIKICTMDIKRIAGKYYISIVYERPNQKYKRSNNDTVGIDFGIKTPLTCYDSNNEYFKLELPKELLKQEKKTEKFNQKFSRTQKGSNRRKKLLLQLQKSYRKEVNIKRQFIEEYTTYLCKNYKIIKFETYNQNISKNNHNNINRAMSRVGLYEFVLRLNEKSLRYHNILFQIPEYTPTTQTCSDCGHRFLGDDKLNISDRTYNCPECGMTLDRDVNAAINIYNYSL